MTCQEMCYFQVRTDYITISIWLDSRMEEWLEDGWGWVGGWEIGGMGE